MNSSPGSKRKEGSPPPGAARTGIRFALVGLAALAAAVLANHVSAQRADQTLTLMNFDVRSGNGSAAVYRASHAVPQVSAGVADARATGMARLRADFVGVDVVDNPELLTPEIVRGKPGSGFLTGPTGDRVGAMRAFLSAYADAYGLAQEHVASLDLVADHENPAGNMAWVELEQRINGLPVFRGLIRGAFTAMGQLVGTTGQLAAGLDAKALPVSPRLTAAQAVSRAAANVGWNVASAALVPQATANGAPVTFDRGPMADEAKAWLMYFPLAPGVACLAWATEIWGNPDAFLILTDAEDGTVLFRKNLTAYQTQTATYNVYGDDSPAPQSPTSVLPGSGTQAPFIGRTSVTLIGNEPPNSFNNLGWMTDGTNSTDGNNVQAGIDRDGFNGVDAPVAGAGRVFNFPYNPQTDEPLTSAYQRGEVTDVFYWTNIYHDRLYLLGFTEAARNFQNDNFGRGGVAGDRISAEAQDSSGTNNANFTASPDGIRGRMQMYIFPGPTPDRTSGLDHDVLFHELTHGTSSRLHNNASGLTSIMSGGMGEGWSDFYARALLSSASEDPSGVYTTGGWLTYQLGSSSFTDNYYYGIRRFPYAVRTTVGANGQPHNPITFADIDPMQINLSDGAYKPAFVGTAFEVHNIGEVWCMALVEVRARFIARLGFAVGNQRILQFVTDGMKLDPVNPTLLQGRDSIIAAATAGGGTEADVADIWSGFAVRGMGLSAQVVNASNGTVVEAFDQPGLTAGVGTLVSGLIPNGWPDPGEVVTVSLCVKNNSATASGSVAGTLLGTGGVQSPSGPQSYGAVPAGGNVCRDYIFTVNASCGATVTATLQTQESGAAARSLVYRFQVGSVSTFFSQNFDGATVPALPAGWTTSTLSGTPNLWVTKAASSDSAPNRVFAADPATISDNVLVSPTIAMPAGTSRLTFRHLLETETSYDGGALEIAIDAGAFQDIVAAGGSFVSGGYTGIIPTMFGNPIGGRQAWTGNSGGYITTTVTMPAAAAGKNVRVRWRMASDSSFSSVGWSLDTIALSSLLCESPSRPTFTDYGGDYDGDGKTDIVVYRASTGYWYVLKSSTSYTTDIEQQWGVSTDVSVPADYDGDGKTDIAVYRPSTGYWYVLQSSTDNTTYIAQQWGLSSDVPVPGDYDGDGKTDIAVYRPSTGAWYILQSSTNNTTYVEQQWGLSSDVPVPGDYDGDGKTDIAVHRPSTGYWYILQSSAHSTTYIAQQWGLSGDIPVAGDYDGDGETDIAVYRPSTGYWYILQSSAHNTTYIAQQWGNSTDIPAAGDYDGDGKTDLALYRPATGYWYVLLSSTNYTTYIAQQWA